MAQLAGVRRRAWLLQQMAGRLRSGGARPLRIGAVPPMTGLVTSMITRGRLDLYA